MHFLTANGGMIDAFHLKAHLYRCNCDGMLDDYIDLHYVATWINDLPEGVTRANFDLGPVLLFAAINIVSNCLVLSLSRLTQHKYRSVRSK